MAIIQTVKRRNRETIQIQALELLLTALNGNTIAPWKAETQGLFAFWGRNRS